MRAGTSEASTARMKVINTTESIAGLTALSVILRRVVKFPAPHVREASYKATSCDLKAADMRRKTKG